VERVFILNGLGNVHHHLQEFGPKISLGVGVNSGGFMAILITQPEHLLKIARSRRKEVSCAIHVNVANSPPNNKPNGQSEAGARR
jgi:hypothetical protein